MYNLLIYFIKFKLNLFYFFTQGEKVCGDAISTVASHLAPVLLREAFVDVVPSAVVPMIAHWPLEELW